VAKTEELEAKIHKVAQVVAALQRENQQLKTECDSLKSHVAMLTTESNKAQRILADYDQIRRKHEQVTHRVERALTGLNALRS
jgi:predicted RNase H-like nuclease (RuvC/YqgF family)